MSDDNSLLDRLNEDLKAAMRNKDKVRLRTLRSLRAALKNKEIDQRQDGAETLLGEQDQLAVLRKQVNQRKDSIEQYEEAGRDDLVTKEQEELAVLEEYMPDQLSDEALEEKLQSIIDDVGAESMADMGAVMGRAMDALRGKVDGGRVQRMVKQLLG
ncbi:glutamyl-tRNA amidotransferase [Salinibacter sp. 10B]|uniref:GatB/YqeY domain-containing protein n=1 Tax=Salinibacter sp. 10B TaxID=1923971 RepID=UPI000CF51167|nr:GatB/YqeY domain-containing protein [Salinibacter sp. 10B]PQJ33503.1 glutamyl-tRNA amidotransferase [Salinibacter sp. 10B]